MVLTSVLLVHGAMTLSHAVAAGDVTVTPASAAAAATRPATTVAPAFGAPAVAVAAAPDTAIDRADWSQTLQQLAALLTGTDLVRLQQFLQPAPPVIRPFASDSLHTPDRLLGATTGSTPLGVHAYGGAPGTLATDLADDFVNAGDEVPQSVRARMLPPNPDAARRANDTAARWLAQVLAPKEHEVVGVIVLWPRARVRSLGDAPTRATFVLVTGEKVDGLFVPRQIIYGDPLESSR